MSECRLRTSPPPSRPSAAARARIGDAHAPARSPGKITKVVTHKFEAGQTGSFEVTVKNAGKTLAGQFMVRCFACLSARVRACAEGHFALSLLRTEDMPKCPSAH